MSSSTISNAFVKQYSSTLSMLVSIQGGKFMGKCLEETINGEEKYYEQLGNVIATERNSQSPDSPRNDITHDRRRVTATTYHTGLGIDSIEKVQMLINPESEYIMRMAQSLNKKRDIEFFKGVLGTAYSGKSGGTSNTLTSSNIVGDDANTGMTIDKILGAKEYFEKEGYDLRDPYTRGYLVMTPRQIRDLLNIDKVTSSDYNIKALRDGQLNDFLGFDIIVSNQVPYTTDAANETVSLTWDATTSKPVDSDGNDIRACFAYIKSDIRFVTNPEIQTEVDKDITRCFDWYAYAKARFGCVRMQEKGVCIIGCDETVD